MKKVYSLKGRKIFKYLFQRGKRYKKSGIRIFIVRYGEIDSDRKKDLPLKKKRLYRLKSVYQ